MSKNIIIAILVIVIVVVGLWWYLGQNTNVDIPNGDENGEVDNSDSPILDDQPEAAEIRNLIVVDRPLIGEQVTSPLTVLGEARGTWYFEATAPMRLEDANGNVIAQGFVTAQGDWMTEDFVPFSGTLTFTAPASSTGTLVLEKSNPSGLEENASELSIPVVFR